VSDLIYDLEHMELKIGAAKLQAEERAELRRRLQQSREAMRARLGKLGLASSSE
jgi:hypothetical protein